MYCTKCGSEVKEGAQFCSKCGHRIIAAGNNIIQIFLLLLLSMPVEAGKNLH